MGSFFCPGFSNERFLIKELESRRTGTKKLMKVLHSKFYHPLDVIGFQSIPIQ